jgi:hypothetical protein
MDDADRFGKRFWISILSCLRSLDYISWRRHDTSNLNDTNVNNPHTICCCLSLSPNVTAPVPLHLKLGPVGRALRTVSWDKG